VGFVSVEKDSDGKTLEQKIGALDITTCEEGNKVTAIGYPAAGEYDGEKMIHAIGPIDTKDDEGGIPQPLGMPSKMTEGSSGGPWVLNKETACGVNSYGYDDDIMYTPYFDQTVFDLRSHALDEVPDGGIEITKHPETARFDQLEPIVFSVEATTSENESLNFQWLYNDYPIQGANKKSYEITNPTEEDIGFYSCKISNSKGWVYSNSAQLSSGSKMEISLFVIFISIFVMMLNYI
jgi:hypothetical protein